MLRRGVGFAMALRGLRARGLNLVRWIGYWDKIGLTVPVSTVGGAQEEVLENNYHPVPEDDLASEN